MYLKKLELQGFKSFADKTTLEFMPGITTVIGPNGSGKSNISDSIRWVLGEQSMKELRGSKSEDIIFAGTQARKSLGFAEASIVFDNSDSKLPIEFSEVTVTRRIYRSGETGYFINKTPCRLKDIQELFMDTGIGKDGYSIIGQGKIDEILSNKSEDRRHIFEEAAGIVKYRARKLEAEKKLEQTKVNLLRINDILSEIEVNIEPLKVQSEKAKKFLDLREELKNIEVGLFLHNIDSYKEKIAEVIENIDVFETQNVKEEERLNNMQTLKENLKTSIDELIVKIENTQNLGFESEKKKEQLNSEINVSNQKIESNIENYDRYATEIEDLKTRIQELEEERKQKADKKENLLNNKEKFAQELKEKEEELANLTAKLTSKELEIEEKKAKLEKNTEDKFEIIAKINTEKANYANLEKREQTLKNEISGTISELDGIRFSKEDIAKGFYELESKRENINKSLEDISKKREESTQKLKEYDIRLNNLMSEQRIKDSKQKFLIETEREKEGYTRSVKALLLEAEKNNFISKGMHGVLANLITVPKEYETAIEMSLGFSMQNIVTDTEEDAKRLVEYLRTNSLGRASFLPISSVKGKKLDNIKNGKMEGIIGIASDLVKFDKKYEQIIYNLLGKTVVVDDMNSAIELSKKNSYSFRVVTLKGDIINPSGAITGGSVATKTTNILGRAGEIKELEKELKTIAKKIEDIQEEKDKYEESIKDVLELSIGLEKEMQDIEIVYATEKQKIVSIDESIAKAEEKLKKLREELEGIRTSKENASNEEKSLDEQIKKIDEENETINTVVAEFANDNKDNQKYIDDLNFDITNLKISVTSFDESQNSIDEIVERITVDIANNEASIKNKTELREGLLKDNEELKQRIEEINKEIEKLSEEVLGSGSKVEELKQERNAKSEKLDKTEEEITEQLKNIDEIKNQISKLEVKKSKLDVELEQVVNKMWEDYELTPSNATEYKKPENVSEVQKRVNVLRNEIKELGSINIDSIKEYKELKERYDFMCEQRLDLETSSNKLNKVIIEITNTMKTQFETQFKIINKNFGEVFKELFGGGKAELILTDEANVLECGIDIQVQPPGKKLQNMTLLSGGERAFTAIALLFAILKINPAPFCVLDEIEAALDDVNVYRFAEYLKKFISQTQFLVITHRKGTMEVADTVYGITMEESGISKLLSMKLKQ